MRAHALPLMRSAASGSCHSMQAAQRSRNSRSATRAQSALVISSVLSAPCGGRPFRGPSAADSPAVGLSGSGVRLSAFFSTAMGVAFMDHSLAADRWKPADTSGNRVAVQRDFGGVAAVEIAMLDKRLVARASFTGCLNECLRHDGREDQQIAEAIHVSKGYLSKLLRSVWAAQAKRLVEFMRETRNLAPLQWMAHQVGCELVRRDAMAERIAELQAELDQMRRVAA